FATANSTAIAVTVSSSVGDMTLAAALSEYPVAAITAPTQTKIWIDPSMHLAGSGGGSIAGGATMVTHGWTSGAAASWVDSGVDINAANHAPTLGNGTLAAVNEDTFNTSGQAVST